MPGESYKTNPKVRERMLNNAKKRYKEMAAALVIVRAQQAEAKKAEEAKKAAEGEKASAAQ
jgi:hypothetical protein